MQIFWILLLTISHLKLHYVLIIDSKFSVSSLKSVHKTLAQMNHIGILIVAGWKLPSVKDKSETNKLTLRLLTQFDFRESRAEFSLETRLGPLTHTIIRPTTIIVKNGTANRSSCHTAHSWQAKFRVFIAATLATLPSYAKFFENQQVVFFVQWKNRLRIERDIDTFDDDGKRLFRE